MSISSGSAGPRPRRRASGDALRWLIGPPAYAGIGSIFRRGELATLVKQALAVSGEPMTTRGMACTSRKAKRLDAEDRFIGRVAHGLAQALTEASEHGTGPG